MATRGKHFPAPQYSAEGQPSLQRELGWCPQLKERTSGSSRQGQALRSPNGNAVSHPLWTFMAK